MATSVIISVPDMELDSIPSGTPLTTIPELPGDECECEDMVGLRNNEDKRMRAMLTDSILITEAAIVNAAAAAATGASSTSTATTTASAYARSKRLSLNMTLLSPALHSPCSSVSTPPSGYFSPSNASSSSTSSAVSSPGSSSLSPSFNSSWNSDMRQYIMTDIGPQPSNSLVPGLRSPQMTLGLVRRRSYSKMGGLGYTTPAMLSPSLSPSFASSMPAVSGGYSKGLGLGLSFPLSPSLPCLVE
ncbi:hypothetical protein B0O80DRAFT_502481 [Mortierella sp. GBAus27b]|nr:hypothetical protein B0O80DRAFT_502481 [Mortierella sp. GBAus27b]